MLSTSGERGLARRLSVSLCLSRRRRTLFAKVRGRSFKDTDRLAALKARFEVRGVPSVVLVDMRLEKRAVLSVV